MLGPLAWPRAGRRDIPARHTLQHSWEHSVSAGSLYRQESARKSPESVTRQVRNTSSDGCQVEKTANDERPPDETGQVASNVLARHRPLVPDRSDRLEWAQTVSILRGSTYRHVELPRCTASERSRP